MKLIYQPLKSFSITQHFGQNKACIPLQGGKVITCDGKNPPVGYRSLYGMRGHQGIDLRARHGVEVYAAQDGTVYQIDTDPKSGLDVRLEHEVNGVRFRTIYEHLMGHQVNVGDVVRVGQLIAWADNTGYSSGDHLHFQMEMLVNGLWTAVDPMLYMHETFANDWLATQDRFKYLMEQLAKLADNFATRLRNDAVINNRK